MRHDARLLHERNSIQTARVIISPTHTHTHTRTGEVGAAFLSFVLEGKGNLWGKDCVEQEALVVRELFPSFNELAAAHRAADSIRIPLILTAQLHYSSAGWKAHGPHGGVTSIPASQ